MLTALMPVKSYHRRFLEEAVESMLSQTSPRWRLLVVTEAEQADELRGVLAEPLADARVELLVNEGAGFAGALNTGLRRAETAYAGFLLGDDLWAPSAVEVLSGYIARYPQVDFFHTGRVIVDDDGRPLSSVHPAPETFLLGDFVRGSPVKHLLCVRREKALEVGGVDESIGSVGPDDWDFPWTMAEAGASFLAVPEALYVYRDHRAGFRLTTHLPLSTHVAGMRRILAKHGVAEAEIERLVQKARTTYLRQCLFRTPADRAWKRLRRFDARKGWRDTYA
jgi:glycosyltransferase involved in cell wall biosynthesis